MATPIRLNDKSPIEKVKILIDYANLLQGTAIASTEIEVEDRDSGDAYPNLVEDLGFESQAVGIKVVGGIDGHRYIIRVRATGDDIASGDEVYEAVLYQDVVET